MLPLLVNAGILLSTSPWVPTVRNFAEQRRGAFIWRLYSLRESTHDHTGSSRILLHHIPKA